MSEFRWPTFDEWRDGLPPEDKRRVDILTDQLRAAGAAEPESWAQSEISENIPQAARFAFLRAVWRNLERWRDPQSVDRFAGERQIDPEFRETFRELVAMAAFEATLDVIMVIDNGEDVDGTAGLPGWLLVETDSDLASTGREIGGLHESLLQVDPLGIEAEDIRGF